MNKPHFRPKRLNNVTTNAKLTFEIAQAIREEYKQGGITHAALAERYNVSAATMSALLIGRTYNAPLTKWGKKVK